MKLDEYEIDYVKYFIQVKGYHQYEVLAEIMDHFILLLEEKREANSETLFEDLVNEAYLADGELMFKEINRATSEKVTRNYRSMLTRTCINFLHYKYVMIMALAGSLLYYLQSIIHIGNEYPDRSFKGVFAFTTYILFFLGGEYSMATKAGNPKFMCNKIAKRYGYYLFVAILLFQGLVRGLVHPMSFGFNIYYLISAVLIVVQFVLMYAIIKTARTIAEDSQVMEETYQVLK